MSRRFHRGRRSAGTLGAESRRTLVASQPFIPTAIFRWPELLEAKRDHLRAQPGDLPSLSAFVVEIQGPAVWRGLGYGSALDAILHGSISPRRSVMSFATCLGM
jgi:hypothetical protein